jgi:hypothetical protein
MATPALLRSMARGVDRPSPSSRDDIARSDPAPVRHHQRDTRYTHTCQQMTSSRQDVCEEMIKAGRVRRDDVMSVCQHMTVLASSAAYTTPLQPRLLLRVEARHKTVCVLRADTRADLEMLTS